MLKKTKPNTRANLNQLPVLRHSERSLYELRLRKSTSINHVLRVVERDPVLAFELFVAANRDLKRAGKPPATNIRRALLVYGLVRYLEHSKSYESLEQHLTPKFLRPVMNHLGRSVLAAKVAECLAQLRGQVNAEDSFCFGLMCDLDTYLTKLISATDSTVDFSNLRTLLPGLATPLISNNPLHWCAEKACKFAEASQYSWDESGISPIVNDIANTLDIDSYEIETKLMKTMLHGAQASKHFNDFPAARYLMNPGAHEPHKALLFPDIRSSKSRQNTTSKTTESVPKTRRTIPQSSDFKRSKLHVLGSKELKTVQAALEKASKDIKTLGKTKTTRTRILPFTLNILTSVLKANRTFFVANTGNGKCVVRLKAGRDSKPESTNIPLAVDKYVVLRKGMAGSKPLHITPQQLAKLENLFDAKLSKIFNGYEVYSIPLKTKKKVIGVVLARFDRDTTNNWPLHFEECCRLVDSTASGLTATNG